MLPQATVDRIANELLAQARTSKFGFTDPSGVPVSPFYRCPELQALPQGLQQEIVEKAHRETRSSPWFVLILVGTIAAAVAGVFFLSTDPATLAWARSLSPVAPALAILLPVLFQTMMTRRAVRNIAQQVAASWPMPARL